MEENDDVDNPFVDIESISLCHSTRYRQEHQCMSQCAPKLKELRHKKAYDLLILAESVFVSPAASILDVSSTSIATCFHTKAIDYEDYLSRNFDGTLNSTHPLAQIYLTSKLNNETYTIKKILQQPDKMEFIEAMEEEVGSMFKDNIWEMVPRSEMVKYYDEQRKNGK